MRKGCYQPIVTGKKTERQKYGVTCSVKGEGETTYLLDFCGVGGNATGFEWTNLGLIPSAAICQRGQSLRALKKQLGLAPDAG